MKIKFLQLKNWLALSLVGLLGFNACQSTKTAPQNPDSDKPAKPQPRSEIALMYGVPTLNYVVKGHVANESGEPVAGVQVVLLDGYVDATTDSILGDKKFVDRLLKERAVVTDEKGEFNASMHTAITNSQRLLVRDIDGETNGAYQNQLIDLKFGDPQTPANGWDLGSVETEVSVKLKKK